jgi:hypothetical protein
MIPLPFTRDQFFEVFSRYSTLESIAFPATLLKLPNWQPQEGFLIHQSHTFFSSCELPKP